MEEITQGDIKDKTEIKQPKMYKVLLLNDDFTSMEFVIHVLSTIFHRNENDAYNIMLKVHEKGSGVCGVYTHEIAETKISEVINSAKKNKFPLRAVMEDD